MKKIKLEEAIKKVLEAGDKVLIEVEYQHKNSRHFVSTPHYRIYEYGEFPRIYLSIILLF